MLAAAAGRPPESVPDERLREFKQTVTAVFSAHASAVLLDPDYGLDAAKHRAPRCGLLLAYEMDGYENPRPHRMLALAPQLSVQRLVEQGADAVKILLSWAPDDDPKANDEKKALIERIGGECEAAGLPFFLEPVVYDPAGLEPGTIEFARLKPEWVVRTMDAFSRDVYRVDVLKVEFPASARLIGAAYTRADALDWYRRADSAAKRPYIYLSAGVAIEEFIASLELALEARARFSGVLCGRANWQDGAAVYAREGLGALERWLETKGVANVRSVNECLGSATPWQSWLAP